MPYSHSHSVIRVKYSPTEITVIGCLVDGILESKLKYIFRPNEGAVSKNVALEFRPLPFRFSVHIKMYINLRSNIPSTNNSSTTDFYRTRCPKISKLHTFCFVRQAVVISITEAQLESVQICPVKV